METEQEEFTPRLVLTKNLSSKKRKQSVTFLDLVQTTLKTGLTGDQDMAETTESSDESEEELLEEEDVGEIAYEMATDAVDEVLHLRKRVRSHIGNLKSHKDKVINKYKAKINDKANDAQYLRFVDKLTYFIAVPIMVFDFWSLGRFPDYGTYNIHLALVLGLVFWRHINYKYSGYHYYLIDFCYFGNYTLCLLLTLLPMSKSAYCASFAYGVGPLGIATILVGNSFVLHSIDKLTSFYIHLKPMITMTNLHWSTQHNKDRGWDLYDTSENTFSFEFFWYYVTNAFQYYIIWAVVYFLILFVVKRRRIKERNYDTLFIYLSNNDKGARKLWYSKGKKFAPFFYMLTHMVIFLSLTCLSFLCFFSMYLNIFMIALTLFSSAWRGATFYMDYFCKQYEINLANIEELYKEIKKNGSDKSSADSGQANQDIDGSANRNHTKKSKN
ncbi:unnamed protein product [Moneuplotes crassus]|uniref:Glycerophosphocholine acyltransferase 1 n=2 Tax=Euplotes crassus TaxID=5936 RepID=A0AAD1UDV3_EUPCR|nr:unnamed protein product [Moneuplotes crassus]